MVTETPDFPSSFRSTNAYALPELLKMRGQPEEVRDRELGRFLLIGDGRYEASSTFRFVTSTADAFDEGDGPRPLEESVFMGLRKHTRRFPGVVLVGRADSNDIQVKHASVSKLLARIHDVDAEGFWIRDADSRNGTAVGNTPATTSIRTSCGDMVRFGDRVFLVRRTKVVFAALASLGSRPAI